MASACEKCHYFICRCGELKALRAEVDENQRLRRIINMAGGSPAPGRLQFTDILLPLEAENEQLKDAIAKGFNEAAETLLKQLRAENERLREGATKLAKLTAEMQTINVELSEKYEKLEQAAKKVASCFPDKIPEGQETIVFNIPAYIIEELKQVLSEQK